MESFLNWARYFHTRGLVAEYFLAITAGENVLDAVVMLLANQVRCALTWTASGGAKICVTEATVIFPDLFGFVDIVEKFLFEADDKTETERMKPLCFNNSGR